MEISLDTILKVFRKNYIVMLAVALVAALLMFVVCEFVVSPTYEATAKVNIKSERTSGSISEDSTGMTYALRMVQTCVEILKSKDFRNTVQDIAALDHKPSYSFSAASDATIIRITASAHDPQEAYDVVKTVAENADALIRSTVTGVEIKVFETPDMPVNPSAPHSARNAVLAFLGTLFAFFAILLVMEMFGTKVKDESELAKRYDLPVIAVIPDFNDTSRKKSSYYTYESRGDK